MYTTRAEAQDILEKLEQGGEYELTPVLALSLLDIARQNRWPLNPVAVGKIEAAISKDIPKGFEYWLLADGSSVRHMLKVKGAQSSLDDE